jgi:hypothetical protein
MKGAAVAAIGGGGGGDYGQACMQRAPESASVEVGRMRGVAECAGANTLSADAL